MSTSLGGHLIGYGIKKKNGDVKRVMFDKPIHNTITKHCINNLLRFNGTDASPTANDVGNYLSLFVKSSETSDRYGVFNFCQLGDGTGTTDVNDTTLKHAVGELTSTKKTGSGWCGTTTVFADALLKERISHVHTITEDFTVREIGWFNKIYPDGEVTLSARVQLDIPVDVTVGDEFYSIYEISMGFQGVERFDDFFGLGPGYKVNAGISSGWGNYPGSNFSNLMFPYINTSGLPWMQTGQNARGAPAARPPWMGLRSVGTHGSNAELYTPFTIYKFDYDKWLPFKQQTFTTQVDVSYANATCTVKPYTMDSFYRDVEFMLSPSYFGSGIYAIILNGTMYRFGTFDENDTFTPTPITINSTVKFTVRQSWSTDLLTPAE